MMSLFNKDCVRKICMDRKMLGQFAIQVHYSKDHKKILKAYHIPTNLIRAEKCDEDGNIVGYYYSDDWTDVKKFVPQRYSAFGTSKDEIEILFSKPYAVGMKYYSYPDYQGGMPYALLEEEVADYLINEVKTSFSGTKIVNFNNGVPTEEQQEQISSSVMGKISGAKGQKTIIAFNRNAESATTVTDVPLNDAPEHYSYLSTECQSKLMLAHNVTSPLLFGIATNTGFSANADELKNSSILFDNMVIRPIQDEILEAFDSILAFNKITLKLYFKTLQPLEFTDLENAQTAEQVAEETGTELSAIDELDLSEFGEDVNSEWLLIDEFEVDYDSEDEIDEQLKNANNPSKSLLSKIYNFVSTGTANPRAKSEQDAVVSDVKFITRYKYSGGISNDSRAFCKKMVSASKVYRKEDILRMSSTAVNKGWGPEGADNYDIFLYKGGGACHHKWVRQTYVAFDSASGIDPLSPRAKTISVAKAEKAGYRLRNPKQVAMRPIDMPNQGFLPTNKRFQ